MRLSLRKALTRTRFPIANKLGRGLLSTSGIVIAAIAEEPIIAAVGVAAEAVPAVRVHNHWLHLGAFDLKRVEFEGQTLCISGCGLTINGECAEVNLEGQWEFLDSWSFVRHKDKHLQWYLRFFYLPDMLRPLGTIRPIQCTGMELAPWPHPDSLLAVLFWDGGRDIARAKRNEERRLLREAAGAPQPRLRAGTRINDSIF